MRHVPHVCGGRELVGAFGELQPECLCVPEVQGSQGGVGDDVFVDVVVVLDLNLTACAFCCGFEAFRNFIDQHLQLLVSGCPEAILHYSLLWRSVCSSHALSSAIADDAVYPPCWFDLLPQDRQRVVGKHSCIEGVSRALCLRQGYTRDTHGGSGFGRSGRGECYLCDNPGKGVEVDSIHGERMDHHGTVHA